MSETNERTMRVIRREAKNLLVARGLRAERVHKFYRDELDDTLEEIEMLRRENAVLRARVERAEGVADAHPYHASARVVKRKLTWDDCETEEGADPRSEVYVFSSEGDISPTVRR